MTNMTIFAKLKEKLLKLSAKENKPKTADVAIDSSVGINNADASYTDYDNTSDSPNTLGTPEIAGTLDITGNNKAIKRKQYNLLLLILAVCVICLLPFIMMIQEKIKHKPTKSNSSISSIGSNEGSKPKLELASSALDPDKMWRNHFEDLLGENRRKFDERLDLAETNFSRIKQSLQEETKLEMDKMQAQLNFAKNELISATEELKRMRHIHEELEQRGQISKNSFDEANINSIDLNSEVEFDQPKDTKIYIPETSYVSGYLLSGMAVSTALSTPDENATPVVIRLTERGNLPKNFNVDISTCRILGSSYGDLSSERAIIRLEKMVCIDPNTELVTTSNIAGTVHGPDGMNGIKGRVVATSGKHIKNALIGGVISGLSQSSRGLDSMAITNLGAVSTKKKGFKDMAASGTLTGASNAAEKIADYYLKMAETMSPILTIPGGVKVDVIFMKGFFIGELSTHKKIRQMRRQEKITERKQNDLRQYQGGDE